MSWKSINLFGANKISRVCGLYQVTEISKIPGGKFKIKVLEENDTFVAIPNVCLRSSDGSPDGLSGMGKSEVEALEDLLQWFMSELQKRENPTDDDFAWSDPVDF